MAKSSSRSAAQRSAERRYDAKRAGKRARAWTALVYPDSAPDGWRDALADQLVQALISPLHDKDVNPEGELKKPHYHVVVSFQNPVTRERAAEVFDAIGAVMPPVVGGRDTARVSDFRQMARYLCHLDQPSKHRYDVGEVEAIGGLDYRQIVMSASDEDEVLDEIETFITQNQVISFVSFATYVRKFRPEWKHFLRHKFSYYIREFIKANEWALYHTDEIEATELLDLAAESADDAVGHRACEREGDGGEAADYDSPSQSSQFPDGLAGQTANCDMGTEGDCGRDAGVDLRCDSTCGTASRGRTARRMPSGLKTRPGTMTSEEGWSGPDDQCWRDEGSVVKNED